MDSSRPAVMGMQVARNDSPEQLLDIFKAAALSVTKLYKTSAKVEARARLDGYQECLEDILNFLNRDNIGVSDGEGLRVRRWIMEKHDGRDVSPPSTESDEEIEKLERTESPEATRTSPESSAPAQIPPVNSSTNSTPVAVVVPTQDTFTFHTSYPNIATLDLSDARPQEGPAFPSNRASKSRYAGGSSRSGPRTPAHLGRGAGAKRRMEFNDLFDGCLDGKDPFGNGNGNKRNRHA